MFLFKNIKIEPCTAILYLNEKRCTFRLKTYKMVGENREAPISQAGPGGQIGTEYGDMALGDPRIITLEKDDQYLPAGWEKIHECVDKVNLLSIA